ncbi:hypothetical protein EYF80_043164 [Liparis tanakae]|uniref:Uncharacterized protein n=1 Tax=Liparis tanakae TaxID=230148 RepID=A0A4Z2G044_9TELE|nr:hypothetical protein EYF80_043164 [Liparis tanakae]
MSPAVTSAWMKRSTTTASRRTTPRCGCRAMRKARLLLSLSASVALMYSAVMTTSCPSAQLRTGFRPAAITGTSSLTGSTWRRHAGHWELNNESLVRFQRAAAEMQSSVLRFPLQRHLQGFFHRVQVRQNQVFRAQPALPSFIYRQKVGELTVWRLLVYKVELLPGYVDHFCFFDHEKPTGTRNLFGWLVWNWLYVHHHHLHHQQRDDQIRNQDPKGNFIAK